MKGIVYNVQENAWMDKTGMLDWIKHVKKPMFYGDVEFTYSLWMNLKSTWWGASYMHWDVFESSMSWVGILLSSK